MTVLQNKKYNGIRKKEQIYPGPNNNQNQIFISGKTKTEKSI